MSVTVITLLKMFQRNKNDKRKLDKNKNESLTCQQVFILQGPKMFGN